MADLAEVCGELVIARPPEFAERAYGLNSLEEKYGCVPESFEPINDGDVDLADIFTTTPAIADNDLVVLEDPENNFIAQQILPLAATDRLPQEAVDALNELSGKLTTEDLIDLNHQVSCDQPVSPASRVPARVNNVMPSYNGNPNCNVVLVGSVR